MRLHGCIILVLEALSVFIEFVSGGALITAKTGTFQGNEGKSRDGREYYEWLGIPYAEPPIGKLRFEPPVPVKPRGELLDASKYSKKCPQVEQAFHTLTGEEDCLYLNIYAPKVFEDWEDTRARYEVLPVMFYIHGGYFIANTGKDFAPSFLMDQDVVLVTINYRLGVLGFLNTGDGVVRGNMGLKDQALALKWVHENIAYFGGDPRKITVFGQSAGGVSAHMHMLSPLSQPYLHKVISQSGTALAHWGINKDPVGQAKWYGNVTGCPMRSTKAMVKCLKDMKVSDLYKFWQSKSIFITGSTWTRLNMFVPTIETVLDKHTFLSEEPEILMKRGEFAKIPWLTGSNSGEGLILAARFYKDLAERSSMIKNWGRTSDILLNLGAKEKRVADQVRDFYFPDRSRLNSDKTFTSIRDMISDRNFFVAQQDALKLHSRHAPAYAYFYNKTGEFSVFDVLSTLKGVKPTLLEIAFGFTERWLDKVFKNKTVPSFGACHGDELLLLAPMNLRHVTRWHRDYEFSKEFVSLWAQFAMDKPRLEFQKTEFTKFNPQEEFKQFHILEENSGIRTVPFWKRYLFWKKFEKIASHIRISNKILD